jgi:hypothetical protein
VEVGDGEAVRGEDEAAGDVSVPFAAFVALVDVAEDEGAFEAAPVDFSA